MPWPPSHRTRPYTPRDLARLKCIRCGARASTQWQVCSGGNTYRPLCRSCDIALNQLVLVWMNHPDAQKLLEKYSRSVVK